MKPHHIGWVGRDLERMQRSFSREGAQVVTEPIADPLQRVRVQFLREPGTGELWELVAPLQGAIDSPLLARLSRGGGFDHVCWELEAGDGTLEELLAREVSRGARVVCEPAMAVAFGRRIAFVYRRSGRIIEFVEQRPSGSLL